MYNDRRRKMIRQCVWEPRTNDNEDMMDESCRRPRRPLKTALVQPTLLSRTLCPSLDPNPRLRAELFTCQRLPDHSLMQVSIHRPGFAFMKDLELVFPSDLGKAIKTPSSDLAPADDSANDFWVIPTFQKAHFDLVAVTEQTGWERDLLAAYFYSFAHEFVGTLRMQGLWADFTDPADGFPHYSAQGSALYPDVEGAVRLLRYGTAQVGCCKVLLHPQWGTRNYPATLFAKGPLDAVQKALFDGASISSSSGAMMSETIDNTSHLPPS